MKIQSRGAMIAAALLSTGALIATPALAQEGLSAEEPELTRAEAIETAADIADALGEMKADGDAQPAPIRDAELINDMGDGEVSMGQVSLDLPTAGDAIAVGKSVVAETPFDGATVVAQAIPFGVRALFTLADAAAPTRYAIPVEGASELDMQPDGALTDVLVYATWHGDPSDGTSTGVMPGVVVRPAIVLERLALR
jgi:hypothetical protein